MEVKLYFGLGTDRVMVESHSVPAYAGRTITRADEDGTGADITSADADLVSDVIDVLTVSDKGVVLSRKVVVNPAADYIATTEGRPSAMSHSVRICAPDRMAGLGRVTVDGEVVWPADEADGSAEEELLSTLEGVSEKIDGLTRQGL